MTNKIVVHMMLLFLMGFAFGMVFEYFRKEDQNWKRNFANDLSRVQEKYYTSQSKYSDFQYEYERRISEEISKFRVEVLDLLLKHINEHHPVVKGKGTSSTKERRIAP